MREIIIYILNTEYKVIFTWGKSEQISKVLKSWGYEPNQTIGSIEDRRGACFYQRGNHPVVAMPRRPKTPSEIGTLAHEATHAVEHIFDYIEQETRGEVFAHSVGAIVRGVLK